jgi:predicted short-subunit dehydrogenase-like oxidoreductase (DUF2520 family)
MKIVIVGTGNVADVLGRKLKHAGHAILQVFGRNGLQAEELAKELESVPCSSWKLLDRNAELVLVAIADKALYELDNELKYPEGIVAHTAGSVSRDVLKEISGNYGVLYPLQSLRKQHPVLTSVPLLVDASNQNTLRVLLELAGTISPQVTIAEDDERLKLHVAAVCVNNFVNHLYAVAADYCKQEKLEFQLLQPLIRETAERIQNLPPRELMTGPAIRNDMVTVDRHLELLSRHPLFQKLYGEMTDSIIEFNRTEEG